MPEVAMTPQEDVIRKSPGPLLTGSLQQARKSYRYCLALGWALVGLGILFRLVTYAWNTGFWYDEGWLIQNIQDRSYGQLAGPLANDQAAPLCYLWLLKGLYDLGGLEERLLRLPALLGSLGAMLLIWPLARRLLPMFGALVATGLFAFSDNILIYTARTKPYTLDAFVTVLLLYTATRLRSRPRWQLILALSALEAFVFWFSYPSSLVYGGIMAWIGLSMLAGRGRDSKANWTALFGGSAGVGAVVFSALKLTGRQRNDFLMEYWGKRGFPMGWAPHELLKWPVDATYRMFEEATRPIGAVSMLLCLVGIFALLRRPARRWQAGLLALPLAVHLTSGAMKLYPWVGSRLTIFNIPMIVLLAGAGAVALAHLGKTPSARRKTQKITFAWVGVALLVPAILAVWHVVWVGHRTAHGRPLARYVQQHFQEDDRILIAGSNEFGIYFRNTDLPVYGGDYPPSDFRNFDPSREQWQRLWVLIRSEKKDEFNVREYLEGYVEPVRTVQGCGAELHIFKRAQDDSTGSNPP